MRLGPFSQKLWIDITLEDYLDFGCGWLIPLHKEIRDSVLQRVAVCCSVLQCVVVCCSMMQLTPSQHEPSPLGPLFTTTVVSILMESDKRLKISI